MFDWLKGKVLDVPDRVNRMFHPRDEFTRPAHIIDKRSLGEKAEIYWQDIQDNWLHGDGGEFYKYADPFDGGDSAYHHGWYTATCALKGDWPELGIALMGVERLISLGMNRRLCRGADLIGGPMAVGDPNRKYFQHNGYVYHQDCSESSLLGLITACFYTFKSEAPLPLKDKASKILDTCLKQIIKDGYQLLNEDGSPAKWGNLKLEFGTAPIRLGTLASGLLLGHMMTGDNSYRMRYETLSRGRMGALLHQETHFLWVYPWYQTILAYQNYSMLAYLDHDRKDKYERAMQLLWERTNHEGNPLYTFLAGMTIGAVGEDYALQAHKTLDEFNTDRRNGRTAKDPGFVDLLGGDFDDGFKWGPKWLRGGRPEAKQPIPVSLRPSADFFWQRNPYSLKGHADHRYNNLDFCLAYYLGVDQGMI